MKNILLVLFSTALLSSMACTNGKAGNDDKSNKKTETKQPAENKSGDEAVKAIHLTKAQFLEKVWDYEKNPDKWVYKGDKPCIIDFYADWCRPCKIAGPILEELAGEYKGQIYVYKINTEQERELAGAFGIQSIPAFLHCPMVGQPQMSAGIAQTPEETKKMFKGIIDEFLLDKKK
ncbi:MAG TPA: thiol reductase thioredoxin [Marinilabiliales bacterium]|jgi:thioredoxin|nr:MAG: hypothetical protein A2W95_16850 [Bacteroidetes bacterium GWA2_40_14]OFX56684.1 MAG: hypothetical protein A2W84_07360 [Bacteroidetes bacterium GWC2_40_13]OFX72409.1 MAG: hypothetical protein A2W96_05115 [Bacteroidetes bacterium GWD2_40_43]OFX95314.1 MAG: hypothetical protein A2W97_07165 [Bacteroidetes bacterium GWE2_40_63]OFY21866.1 MAG: hypothetical protein A2W88_13210 [Bacteroidetes bacterium GWF2_40_13]OFZ26125.1 MAG: hypothetical protein A2437_02240 [Bacteroidetes bacterium RIFOXYC